MANIAMISLYDRNAYGVRLMSSALKKQGHTCAIIFLKRYSSSPTYQMDVEVGEYPWMGIAKNGRTFKYASNSPISEAEYDYLRQVIEEIEPDMIGVSVTTPLRSQAVSVTRFIKQHFEIPVLWGGYDPTVNPEACLELCDYICAGEGDGVILDIADRIDEGRGIEDIANVGYHRDGTLVANPKRPLDQELDKYPWRDTSPENKFFIEDGKLERNHARQNDKPQGIYQTMSARGCPYKCSYCCEATFKGLYEGEKFLRRRSPENMVAELEVAKRDFGLTKIHFDDEIFGMHVKWLEEFVPLYKEKIDIPFTAYIYPSRSIKKILELLKYAGMDYCCLALESGSVKINKEVFQRVYDRDLFMYTAQLCKELGIGFYTDVITYNPYEEEDDLRQTLDVLIGLNGGFDMCVNKLFVLPGTKMAQQMEREGVLSETSEKDAMFNYYSRLFWITSFTKHSRFIVNLIDKCALFRRYPRLLNPALLEVVVNPASFALSVLRTRLPLPVLQAMQTVKGRLRLLVRKADTSPTCT